MQPIPDLVLGETLQQDLLGVLLPLQSNEVHLVHAQPLIDLLGNASNVGLGGIPQPVPGTQGIKKKEGSRLRREAGIMSTRGRYSDREGRIIFKVREAEASEEEKENLGAEGSVVWKAVAERLQIQRGKALNGMHFV